MATQTLVIAEKPSVAMSIAAVLGAGDRKPGYIQGSGYLVSWCFGHLAELANADAYDEKYAKWRYEDLPILPEPWKHKISRDKYKQFEVLRELMHRSDVGQIVNACDAGREGELIFRNVYQMTGCTKPVKRLWISSMEDEAIRKGFETIQDGTAYDNLYASASCRAKADWLVGINATRLFSVLYHRTLNVGRVMSPTLALLVQREAEISAFQSESYYTVQLALNGCEAISEKFKDRKEADRLAASCTGQQATLQRVERREKTEKASALYDLTTLQRDANRLSGYTAQQTLDYLQSLYEKKLCTYPRTDARYLPDEMERLIPELAAVSAGISGANAPKTLLTKQVCNSSKVTDHHAIVPTISAGKADLEALPTGERELLRLVARQLLCAVSEAHRYIEITAVLDCSGNPFTVKGKAITTIGWKVFLSQESQKSTLPELTEGQTLEPSAVSVREGKTTTPKHYTEDTLLSAMEAAGANYRVPAKSVDFVGKGGAAERVSFSPLGGNERYGACDDAPEDTERKGLGTPATRAAIIEKLISAGFAERKKAKKAVHLIPTRTGVSLITVLPEQLQSPLLTAEWEHRLKQVERGELSEQVFLEGISQMVRDLVRTYQIIPGAEVLFPSGRQVVGKCPRCGSDVTESKKGFFCERNECRFGLWRDNKFLTAKRIQLTNQLASALLQDGRTHLTGIWSEKTGKTYDATVVLTDDGQKTLYRLEFQQGTTE